MLKGRNEMEETKKNTPSALLNVTTASTWVCLLGSCMPWGLLFFPLLITNRNFTVYIIV